ncbi:nucleotidyltransferase domain-containing protein [Streptomyces sp. NPDC101194]|uniref:nucleotidyltransferase domain-containing protein n=1 Tax=Streptomyces sp. NPDC101194 TaxID=3366127 RepID=UPI0038045519
MDAPSPKDDAKVVDDLDPARRDAFAQALSHALAAHCPGSRAEPKGSLARGTADAYSDIDLVRTVPDDRFDACVAAAGKVLEAVRPLRLPAYGTRVAELP